MPEEMSDADGNIVWRARYSTWGRVLFENTTKHAPKDFEQNLRMQGQYDDRECGLYYNTFRYYDADSGRFTTEDPIGLNGGDNLYQYAPNSLMWIDPWGLKNVSPKTVLFSQKSINPDFRDERSVNSLIGRLRKDPSYINNVDPIRKVRMGDLPASIQAKLKAQGAHAHSVFTLDNRRLYAAKQAGVKSIPSRWATPAELKEINLKRRFSTKTGGKSIEIRGKNGGCRN